MRKRERGILLLSEILPKKRGRENVEDGNGIIDLEAQTEANERT
jgi:hypothetical protein